MGLTLARLLWLVITDPQCRRKPGPTFGRPRPLISGSWLSPALRFKGRVDANQQDLAGASLSARGDVGRQGGQFRAVFGACRTGRAVPVRPHGPARDGAR